MVLQAEPDVRRTTSAQPGTAVPRALSVERFFTRSGEDPYADVQWELRSASITDETGSAVFEQKDVEIPAGWTQLATNVIVSKYFYGENGTPERERSVRQLIHRVTRTIADWGKQDGYFASDEEGEQFYRELTWLCLHQHGAFNSPVWFNVGLYHQYGVAGDKCNWRWNRETLEVEQPENPATDGRGQGVVVGAEHEAPPFILCWAIIPHELSLSGLSAPANSAFVAAARPTA